MSELPKKLKKSLRDIKEINNVVHFLSLLISFKKLLKSKQIKLPNSFGCPNTDTEILLNNLVSLFDPLHDYSKNIFYFSALCDPELLNYSTDFSKKVKEKLLWIILKRKKDLTQVWAPSLEEETSDDLRHPTETLDFYLRKIYLDNLKQQDNLTGVSARGLEETTLDVQTLKAYIADFSENPLKKRSLDNLKQQDDLTAVSAHGLEKKTLDDPSFPTDTEDFSENPIKREYFDNLKQQEDIAGPFVHGLEEKALDDKGLPLLFDDSSVNTIDKRSYDKSKKIIDSTDVSPVFSLKRGGIRKQKCQNEDVKEEIKHLDNLKLLTIPIAASSVSPIEKDFCGISKELTDSTSDFCTHFLAKKIKTLDELDEVEIDSDNKISFTDAAGGFSETVIEKITSADKSRLILSFLNVKNLEKNLLDLLKIPGQNSHLFFLALSKLIWHLHHQPLRCDLIEHLNSTIKETENIITASCKYNSRPPFHEDEDSLNVLKIGLCIVNQTCDAKSEEILGLLLESRLVNLTESDKKTIGNLMIDAIDPIQLYIQSVFRTYRSRSYSSILKKKSALQILFDDYAEFLSVSKNSEYQKIEDSIEILDKINTSWCDNSDDSESDFESGCASNKPEKPT